jgi:hypothetical protein
MSDLSYDKWRRYIFDREASEDGDAWYWADDVGKLEMTNQQAARYTTRLFTEPGQALAAFSDA